jgi:hypothetical protein
VPSIHDAAVFPAVRRFPHRCRPQRRWPVPCGIVPTIGGVSRWCALVPQVHGYLRSIVKLPRSGSSEPARQVIVHALPTVPLDSKPRTEEKKQTRKYNHYYAKEKEKTKLLTYSPTNPLIFQRPRSQNTTSKADP